MLKRLVSAVLMFALGAAGASLIWAAFITPHDALGTVNTAVTSISSLYICQPSGTTISPQCPIDTAGADETIFAATEDLSAGGVAWQKVRLTNAGTDPWDIIDVQRSWIETSDPGGLCTTIPEAITHVAGVTTSAGAIGPGITALGISFGGGFFEPAEGVEYTATANDNHGSVASSTLYTDLNGNNRTVHISPGGFEDMLLGIRLPIGTSEDCLNVVWQLTTTWNVQVHNP